MPANNILFESKREDRLESLADFGKVSDLRAILTGYNIVSR